MRAVSSYALVIVLVGTGCGKTSVDSSAAPSAPPAAPAAPVPSSTGLPAAAASATASATATLVPDAIIAQHILVAYKNAKRAPKGVTRTKAEAKARAEEALTKVRTGASFEDAVKEYSDDAGSADRLGSVGKFRRTDMDPSFSAAAFALRVGQVSDVVETPFGFHLIKRTQ
jgi:peptidyl-prolyl cis-trans isomerase NIMA-interacting 1